MTTIDPLVTEVMEFGNKRIPGGQPSATDWRE